MARRSAGLVLIAFFVFPSMVLGFTEFVVGGNDGWKAGVVDYSAWASGYTFSAGDVLDAGNYYFFCDEHCEYGEMKFMITVS
ncbi:uncharacterized protein LOC133713903 isoform X2 [Rosa rugosa]|uniref:uncharacterized protein LOC133713903 isoform X2 n=1 Tax=Rosa rugosa TaxID=74645 RepID=UPI002B40CF46|nr:uncharacterized protein LOC133713903 isoform X2 [Rosa rugosa]